MARILALSHSSGLAGAEQVFLETFSGLTARGHAVIAILPSEGPLAKALREAGVEVRIDRLSWWIQLPGELDLPVVLGDLWPQVERLMEIVRDDAIDIIHSNTTLMLQGALAARYAGCAHVWQVYDMLGDPDWPFPPTLGPALTWHVIDKLADALVVPSETFRELITGHAPEARPVILHHGHDLSKYAEIEPQAEVDPARFLVISTVTERKGLRWLIETIDTELRPLVGELPEGFVIDVVGDRADQAHLAELEALLEKTGLAGRMNFLGYRSDLADLLARARAVLHPSRSDPSPVAIVLAMAAGKPVVATACGGPEKMMTDGQTGRIVGLEDKAGFAAAIARLLKDPDADWDLGAAGRDHAQSAYSLEAYLTGMEGLYADVAGTTRSPEEVAEAEGWRQWLIALNTRRVSSAKLAVLSPREHKILNLLRRITHAMSRLKPGR